jgi:hypothetical protein
VTTEEQRDGFRGQLTKAEDWLYMDPEAEAAKASTFKARLADLKKVGDPIKLRVYESSRRPERIAGAKLLVDLVEKSVNSWPEAKPWLNTTHIKQLADMVCSDASCVLLYCTAKCWFIAIVGTLAHEDCAHRELHQPLTGQIQTRPRMCAPSCLLERMYLYMCIYIHTYIHAYIRTYLRT